MDTYFRKNINSVLEFLKSKPLSTGFGVILLIVFTLYSWQFQVGRESTSIVANQTIIGLSEIEENIQKLRAKSIKLEPSFENYNQFIFELEKFNSRIIELKITAQSLNINNSEVRNLNQKYIDYLDYFENDVIKIYTSRYIWHRNNYQDYVKLERISSFKEKQKIQDILNLTNLGIELIESERESITNIDDTDLKLIHLRSLENSENNLRAIKKYLENQKSKTVTKEIFRYITQEIFKNDIQDFYSEIVLTFDSSKIYTQTSLILRDEIYSKSVELAREYELIN
jgi:hypothetical protein